MRPVEYLSVMMSFRLHEKGGEIAKFTEQLEVAHAVDFDLSTIQTKTKLNKQIRRVLGDRTLETRFVVGSKKI